MKILLSIGGASGSIYGIRLLEELVKTGVEVHLIVSEGAKKILEHETKYIYKNLKNKDMYPVTVLSECWHAKFDVSMVNIFAYLRNETDVYQSDCVYESIAWRLARKMNGGSIAVLTQTQTSRFSLEKELISFLKRLRGTTHAFKG